MHLPINLPSQATSSERGLALLRPLPRQPRKASDRGPAILHLPAHMGLAKRENPDKQVQVLLRRPVTPIDMPQQLTRC